MKHISLMIALALIVSFAVPEAFANVPKAAVYGAVFDGNGERVPNAMLRFGVKTEERGLVVIETMTDDKGNYFIERIPAGPVRVKIEAGERGNAVRDSFLEENVINKLMIKLG